ncbi:hypothetical protein PQG02_12075 [Nostoc sp. UHCC 0926]|uniref:hypothetical protein n=1 Tax=unclassified Nostoc TaxID=2593658 RepID=UPI00235DE94C|nr:hypothetical protein [Nostoc sp. UHCC 0926]WDD35000.1 hypothetical protein PQG02_12075 [Nostoc sp. UHCC 0926]
MKFPRKLGVVKAKIHHDLVGKLRTVTISQMSDGRYYASLLIDDEAEKIPSSNASYYNEGKIRNALAPEGKVIGIDLGLIDFAVTPDGSKYQNPKHLIKIRMKLKA